MKEKISKTNKKLCSEKFTVFYLFVHLFNGFRNRKQLDSHTCSAFSLLQYIILVKTRKTNLGLYVVEKGGIF